ncbi:MAG: PP2C family protein-serine/threonine phosphatase [Chloroflexota bacterium]
MILLEAAALADPGRVRSLNEDRAWMQIFTASGGEAVGLFIVCDGIGGHQGGEVASHWAVEAARKHISPLFTPPDPRSTLLLSQRELEAAVAGKEITRYASSEKHEEIVRQAIERANQVVLDVARQKPNQAANAGTTITMAVVIGSRAVIGNVGDSRTYLLRDGRLVQLTEDHSLVARMAASGLISRADIFVHPQRNLIYRSLGQKSELTVDIFVQYLQSGDYLLLCSDGLWEMVQDEKVMARLVLESGSPQLACQKLIEAANQAGGQDNISAVVVKVI